MLSKSIFRKTLGLGILSISGALKTVAETTMSLEMARYPIPQVGSRRAERTNVLHVQP
jgi:hypothetical protein